MTIDNFWNYIEEARRCSSSTAELPEQLARVLSQLPIEEIVSFGSHFGDCINRANDGCLWLAASVLRGGCSDDSFSDFMGWLIAQGGSVFEAALRDPDSIAELGDLRGQGGLVCLEAILSVDTEAYTRQTGLSDLEAVHSYEQLCAGRQPARWGTRNRDFLNFSDEEGAEFFPRLAARHAAERARERSKYESA